MVRPMVRWTGLALVLWACPANAEVVLQATSATVAQPGDSADICVVLDSGGSQVAGVENKLVWDGSCATLPDASDCHLTSPSDVQFFGNLSGEADFTLHVLVLSFNSVAPIPDGELYCCAFQIEAAPGTCCPIRVVDSAASSPEGHPEVAEGSDALACTSESGATPVPGRPSAAPQDGDSGCAIGPRERAAPTGVCAVGLALALARRWRRRVRSIQRQ